MKTLLVSEFKARCVTAINEVARERDELIVTKRGVPLVRIVPIAPSPSTSRVPGDALHSVQIHGNLLEMDANEEWESLAE